MIHSRRYRDTEMIQQQTIQRHRDDTQQTIQRHRDDTQQTIQR